MVVNNGIKKLILSFLEERIVVMSWGIFNINVYESKVSFNVNGLQFKGHIEISCDNEVYTIKIGKQLLPKCGLANLVTTLDKAIEKTDDYLNDLDKLMN